MYYPNTQRLIVFNLSERNQLQLFDYFKNEIMEKNPPQFESSQGFTVSFGEDPHVIRGYYEALIGFSKDNSCRLYVQLHDVDESSPFDGSKEHKHVYIIENGISTDIVEAIHTLIKWEQLETVAMANDYKYETIFEAMTNIKVIDRSLFFEQYYNELIVRMGEAARIEEHIDKQKTTE